MALRIRMLPEVVILLLLTVNNGICASDPEVDAIPGSLWYAALEHSIALRASDLTVESVSRLYSASGRLPDPILRAAWAPSPLETRNGPVDFTVTIMQRIPWPGILAASRDEMSLMEERASLQHWTASLELRTSIAGTWSEMFVARNGIAYMRDELERLGGLMEVADIRYRTGSVGLTSILFLENRTVQIDSKIYGLELTMDALEFEMESLIGTSFGDPVWPDSLPGASYFLEGVDDSVDVLETPSVLQSILQSESRRAEAASSRAAVAPNLEVGATWSGVGEPVVEMGAVEPGRDALMVFAGLSLPLGYSGSRDRSAAAVFSVQASELRLAQDVADVTARRQMLVNELLGRINMRSSYLETVLPNLEAVHELAVSDWMTGRADMTTVIDTMGDLEEARFEELRLYAGIVVTYARIIELEGRETERGEFL